MFKFPYVDDPEPKDRPEDLEDKIIRKGGKIFDIVIAAAGAALLILFVYGVILRNFG